MVNHEYGAGYNENDVVEKFLVINTLVSNYNNIYLNHAKCIICNRKNKSIILFYSDYLSKQNTLRRCKLHHFLYLL